MLPSDRKPGTLVVSAIYGLGGIGKSVLASALAHDPDVQAQFTDGVLWATLGQNPDLLPLLSSWIQALGDYTFKPTSAEIATSHLRTLLYDKRMLLVVDDVWNPDHADPFRVGGDDCCVLVTTRSAQLSDVTPYDLDVMSESQSVELLSNALWGDLSDAETAAAHDLAREVGFLPLALELAASQVDDGVPWIELLQALRQEIVELDALDRVEAAEQADDAKRRKHSLVACFNLSLRLLSSEQLGQFAGLGVLPEDVGVTAQMAATLWNKTVPKARKTLVTFKRKALLLAGSETLEGEATYRMHDLMHDLAVRLLQSPVEPEEARDLPGLGLTKAAAHGQLLERYRAKTQYALWHTLSEDGYIHAHLTWHMEQAGQPEAIHALLRETRVDRRNGWYEACDAIGQPAQFVSDLGRAWRLAEELFERDRTDSIVLQCRYGLIKTTLNTLAQNIPPELIAVFVKNGFWSPAQGLAYAQQAQRDNQKSRIIQALVANFPKSLLPKALEVTRQIHIKAFRAAALGVLAEKLPELYPEALEVTRQIQDKSSRAAALGALAEKLPELYPEALKVTRQIRDESSRAVALIKLAEKLPELYPEALEVTRQIRDKSSRAVALIKLAKKLPESLWSEALKVTRQIKDEHDRMDTSRRIEKKLPESLWSEALEVTRQIKSEFSRAAVLGDLAEKLPEFLWPKALQLTEQIKSESFRTLALGLLAEKLPESLWPEALEVTRQIKDESFRAAALGALAEKLPELYPEALELIRQTQNEASRAATLKTLAKNLPESLWPEALEMTRQIKAEYCRASALIALVEKLPELYPEALEMTHQIQDEASRAYILIELAEKLPESLRLEALEVTSDKASHANALITLVEKLPELYPEALEMTRQIPRVSSRAAALIALAEKLPELYPEALKVTRQIPDEASRANALIALAEKLPELYPEALKVTRQIPDKASRANALGALAEKLPELYPEALEVTWQIPDVSSRADALIALINRLSSKTIQLSLWQQTLDIMACQTRRYYLSHLASLNKAIFGLTGDGGLRGVAEAMREVCEWWP
ncbi:hypothetical protein C8B47_14880 [filamentous cyanobacterium CCP4]|nr:hypothetical protein C8B47_14880 [filamentous cyanobacterium CCP4]